MRKIEISIETAQRCYNGTDKELKEFSLKAYPELEKKELPERWVDLITIEGYWLNGNCDILKAGELTNAHNKNVFATKEQAEASIALAQLSQLREVYRNGWVPDWTDFNFKYCISFTENKINKDHLQGFSRFLSFQDEETRDLFLENFRELIEQAKPLMT